MGILHRREAFPETKCGSKVVEDSAGFLPKPVNVFQNSGETMVKLHTFGIFVIGSPQKYCFPQIRKGLPQVITTK